MVRNMDSGARELGFKSQVSPLLAMWFWENSLNSPCLSFPLYKMEVVRPSCRLLRWPQILYLPPSLHLHRCGICSSIPWVWVGSVTFFGQCTIGKCDTTSNVTDACRALVEAEHLMEWHLSADAVSPGEASRRTTPQNPAQTADSKSFTS